MLKNSFFKTKFHLPIQNIKVINKHTLSAKKLHRSFDQICTSFVSLLN